MAEEPGPGSAGGGGPPTAEVGPPARQPAAGDSPPEEDCDDLQWPCGILENEDSPGGMTSSGGMATESPDLLANSSGLMVENLLLGGGMGLGAQQAGQSGSVEGEQFFESLLLGGGMDLGVEDLGGEQSGSMEEEQAMLVWVPSSMHQQQPPPAELEPLPRLPLQQQQQQQQQQQPMVAIAAAAAAALGAAGPPLLDSLGSGSSSRGNHPWRGGALEPAWDPIGLRSFAPAPTAPTVGPRPAPAPTASAGWATLPHPAPPPSAQTVGPHPGPPPGGPTVGPGPGPPRGGLPGSLSVSRGRAHTPRHAVHAVVRPRACWPASGGREGVAGPMPSTHATVCARALGASQPEQHPCSANACCLSPAAVK